MAGTLGRHQRRRQTSGIGLTRSSAYIMPTKKDRGARAAAPSLLPDDPLELLPEHLRRHASLTGNEICDHVLRINRSALWKRIRKGQFPPPTKLGDKRTTWPTLLVARHLAAGAEKAERDHGRAA